MSKESMISSQLIARGISNDQIIDAFSAIDREDFVLLKDKRNAYSDIELQLSTNKILVRSFVLAKILEKIIERSYENIMIAGDSTGYTSLIFQNLFKKVTIGTFENSNIEKLRSKIEAVKVSLIYDLRDKFDLIFLDSGFYKDETIRNIKKLLSTNGNLIYFSKEQSFEFSPRQFDFFDVSVVFEDGLDKEIILKMPLLFPNDVVN